MVLLGLVLAACSGDSDSGDSGEGGGGAPLGELATSTSGPEPTPGPSPTPGPRADVIFFNGQVITIDPDLPAAEAVAILGEEILLVGSDQEVLALAGPNTQTIDLAGRALLPGFVDPHNHAFNEVYLERLPAWRGLTYVEGQRRLLAAGTTTLGNTFVWRNVLDDFIRFADSGALRVRSSYYMGFNTNCGGLFPQGWYLDYPLINDPAPMFRLAGIKFFTDGGSCGAAAVSYPAEAPGGDLFISVEELAAGIREAQAAGYQATIHAVGDRGLDVALGALELVLDGGPNSSRHRIDHNRIIRPDQLTRYGELDVVAVVFSDPRTCNILNGAWSGILEVPAGDSRPLYSPWRELIDVNPGLHIAWHSDAPRLFPLEPLTHLWSLVPRQSLNADGSACEPPDDWVADGAVSVSEALRMMTIEGAYALGVDGVVGSLEAGKFADLVLLAESPLEVEPDTLLDIPVLMTMVGGRVEHCADQSVCPAR